MNDQEKVDIYEILDMFNDAIGYRGLNNNGKITSERDDVISRHSFNNWLREYNNTRDESEQIHSEIIDQRNNQWLKSDIEKLIQDKNVRKKLKNAYLRNTVNAFQAFNDMGFLPDTRVSKESMTDEYLEQPSDEHLIAILFPDFYKNYIKEKKAIATK